MLPQIIGYLGLNITGIRSVYDNNWLNKNLLFPKDQLSSHEQLALHRIETLAKEIFTSNPTLERNSLSIGAATRDIGLCQVFGSRKFALLLFSRNVLNSLSPVENELQKMYRRAWEKDVKALPDSLEELKVKISDLGERDLLSLVGLYQQSQFCLTDDELYFVLKHEMLGHVANSDNEKRLALKLISLVVLILAMDFLKKSRDEEQLVTLSLLSFIIPPLISCLAVDKLTNKQEYQADYFGFNEDERGRKGALSFFKKEIILNLASRRYTALTGNVLVEAHKGYFGNFKEGFDIGHPSFEKRYLKLQTVSSC